MRPSTLHNVLVTGVNVYPDAKACARTGRSFDRRPRGLDFLILSFANQLRSSLRFLLPPASIMTLYPSPVSGAEVPDSPLQSKSVNSRGRAASLMTLQPVMRHSQGRPVCGNRPQGLSLASVFVLPVNVHLMLWPGSRLLSL